MFWLSDLSVLYAQLWVIMANHCFESISCLKWWCESHVGHRWCCNLFFPRESPKSTFIVQTVYIYLLSNFNINYNHVLEATCVYCSILVKSFHRSQTIIIGYSMHYFTAIPLLLCCENKLQENFNIKIFYFA